MMNLSEGQKEITKSIETLKLNIDFSIKDSTQLEFLSSKLDGALDSLKALQIPKKVDEIGTIRNSIKNILINNGLYYSRHGYLQQNENENNGTTCTIPIYSSKIYNEIYFDLDDLEYMYDYSSQNLYDLWIDIKNNYVANFKNYAEETDEFKKIVSSNISKFKQQLKDLVDDEGKMARNSIDRTLTLIALPLFGLILITVFLFPIFITSNSTDQKLRILLYGPKGLILELLTVFMLISAILILAIGDKIEQDVLSTLLGAISAYVLQKSLLQSGGNWTKNEPQPTDKKGSISGIVVDKVTQQVIAGAIIDVKELPTTYSTLVDGTFKFEKIKAQVYSLEVSKGGYKNFLLTDIAVDQESNVSLRIELEQENV
jgi:hypothetical protein